METITPNLLGSYTVAKTIVAYFLDFEWQSMSYWRGKSQIISLLKTKNFPLSLSFLRISSASLIGPAVPNASFSLTKVILVLYF